MQLNTAHFIKSESQEQRTIFVGDAVKSHYQIKQKDDEQAKRYGSGPYQFALDNKDMDVVDFSREASALIIQ